MPYELSHRPRRFPSFVAVSRGLPALLPACQHGEPPPLGGVRDERRKPPQPCRFLLSAHHPVAGDLAIRWRLRLEIAPRRAVYSKLLLERLGDCVPLLLVRVDARALGIARLIRLDAQGL